MLLPEKYLFTKRSGIADTGKGLFTKIVIKKGTQIVEYKGKKRLSKKVSDKSYAYNISKDRVIDAKNYTKGLAHFANDADGLFRKKGLTNNCVYIQTEMRVYIVATKNIAAGREILVSYGKKYWQPIFDYLQKLTAEETQSGKRFSSHTLKNKNMAKAKKAAKKKTPVKKAAPKKAAAKKKAAVKPAVKKKAAAPKKAIKKAVAKKALRSGKFLLGKSGKTGG